MTSDWKPTVGVQRAYDIVQQLAEDGAAANNLLDPILQHRMVTVIAAAIDRALADGAAAVSEPELPVLDRRFVEDVPDFPVPSNGRAPEVRLQSMQDVREWMDANGYLYPSSADDGTILQMAENAGATIGFILPVEKPTKRGRGRPKGPGKKKAKKAKGRAAKAPEANPEPAVEPVEASVETPT